MKNIVFFSGGSALAAVARVLAAAGQSPVYLITTFDSGGSTQAIRRVFAMPAVGDLRNRLLACAPPDASLEPVVSFLKFRLGKAGTPQEARDALRGLIADSNYEELPCGQELRADLEEFLANMPQEFDARNASIGNLAITGAWLRLGRKLGAALERYSKLLHVSARLVPIVAESLHLGLEMADGSIHVGQHLFNQPLPCRLRRIFLTALTPWESGSPLEERPQLTDEARVALAQADMICFPMGSFYSSILSNLLPRGVGSAIAASQARKVFIPNTGIDPELQGLDLAGQIALLLATLKADAPAAGANSFLDMVLADGRNGDYPGSFDHTMRKRIADMGICAVDAPVVNASGRHDPVALMAELERLL